MHDLLVIGGGPAGATCARRAAQRGLDVVLIEKAVHPREKVCGGCLSPRTTDLLDFDISHLFEREFHAALVHTPTRRSVLTRDGFRGHLIRRSAFDEFLLRKAHEAGVEIVQGTRIIAIEQLRKGIRALGIGESYRAHLLVGADGVNGIASKELRIRNGWRPDSVAVCIKAEVQMDPSDIDRLFTHKEGHGQTIIDLFYGHIEFGYGWCFPYYDTLNIGIGCRMDKAGCLRDRWKNLISYVEKTKGLHLTVTGTTSARVPFCGSVGRYVARRSMLIGDAAGLVSPVSGEGISYAIESGIIAADVAFETVKDRTPAHIVEYEQRLERGLLRELRELKWVAGILYRSNTNVDLICAIVDEDPLMREYMTDLLARTRPQRSLMGQIRKRMLLKHPLKAIRLGLH